MMFGIPCEMSLSAHFSLWIRWDRLQKSGDPGSQTQTSLWGASQWDLNTLSARRREAGVGGGRHRAPGFGSHVAGKPLSLPTSWRKRVLKESQLNEQAAIKKGCPQI